MHTATVLGLLFAAIALLGCGALRDDEPAATPGDSPPATQLTTSTIPAPPRSTEPPASVTSAPAPAPVLTPVAVRVPRVGIDSVLVPLGLNPDNTLEVPRDFSVAGWYIYRPVPGDVGPSIIAGHVDSRTGPAVFYRLRELEPGDSIEVERDDGSVAVFTVTAREQYDKDDFPTERVYGPTEGAELRMITCGGTFDRSVGHYDDNIVVFARLGRIDPPAAA